MASEQADLVELRRFINAQITNKADGAGSDLVVAEVVDETWTYVEGNLDVQQLAGELLHAGWRKA